MTHTSTKPIRRWRCTATPLLWLILIITSILLLGLAYWQLSKGLHRYAEDQAQAKLHAHDTPLSLKNAYQQWQKYPTSIQDSTVLLHGKLVQNTLFLHDNRILNGKAGYGVYTLLQLPQTTQSQLEQHTHMLVQIGWHPIPNFDRTVLPQLIITEKKQISIQATLEHIFPNVFTLNKNPPEFLQQTLSHKNEISDIIRMQTIDFKSLNQRYNAKIIPFVARTQQHLSLPPLIHNTQPIANRGISAEKHFGYSLQWFIFWCIALGVFLYTQCSCYDVPHVP